MFTRRCASAADRCGRSPSALEPRYGGGSRIPQRGSLALAEFFYIHSKYMDSCMHVHECNITIISGEKRGIESF